MGTRRLDRSFTESRSLPNRAEPNASMTMQAAMSTTAKMMSPAIVIIVGSVYGQIPKYSTSLK
jgi:hypothetical protein